MRISAGLPIILYVLLLLPGAAAGSGPTFTERDAVAAFVKGNLAYKDGQYQQAIDRYQEILNGGMESGALYYNLGNSYLKSGDLGRAILNYKKAQQFMPRDEDLKTNIRFALAQKERNYRLPGKSFWRRFLENSVDTATARERVWAIVIFAVAGSGLALAGIFLSWTRLIRQGILALAVISCLYQTTVLVMKKDLEKDRAVIVEETEARFEPRDQATSHFSVKTGEQVQVVGEAGDWKKIKRLDEKSGWVPAAALERI